MPSGKVHLRVWTRLLKPVMIAVSVLLFVELMFYQTAWTFFLAPGYLVGYYLDPDLDQIGLTAAEGRMMRAWGFLGACFVAYWLPYAYLHNQISKHRGYSHWPLVGTMTRWLWLWLPYVVAHTYFHLSFPVSIIFNKVVLFLFLGNSIADYIHAALDFGWPLPYRLIGRR